MMEVKNNCIYELYKGNCTSIEVMYCKRYFDSVIQKLLDFKINMSL